VTKAKYGSFRYLMYADGYLSSSQVVSMSVRAYPNQAV